MRMRKKPNLEERLKRCEQLVIKEPESLRGKWSELSGGRRICLEIGCGKGRFITETAKESQETFLSVSRESPGQLSWRLRRLMLPDFRISVLLTRTRLLWILYSMNARLRDIS